MGPLAHGPVRASSRTPRRVQSVAIGPRMPWSRLPPQPKMLLPGFQTRTNSGTLVQTPSVIYLNGASYNGGIRGVALHDTPIHDAPRRCWMIEAEANRSGTEGSPYPLYTFGLTAERDIATIPFGHLLGGELFINAGTTFGSAFYNTALRDYDWHKEENYTMPGYRWAYAGMRFRLAHVGGRKMVTWCSADGVTWEFWCDGIWRSMPNLLYPYMCMRGQNDGWRNPKLWLGN